MAVPPLHEGILRTGVDRVALQRPGDRPDVVEDVQDRDRDDGRDVEPDRHVNVALAADPQSAEEVQREDHPDQSDRDVNRPLELGVLLALGVTHRQRDRRSDDDPLPAPEVSLAQLVAEHARLQQTLHRVVHRSEDAVAREGKDHRIGVKRTETTEAEVLRPLRRESEPVEPGLGQLECGDEADQHADRAPDQGGKQKFADDRVVVAEALERRSCSRAGRWDFGRHRWRTEGQFAHR